MIFKRREKAETTFPWLDLDDRFDFPDARTGAHDGPLAQGGNLSPGMLLSAYRQGIFPWFSEGDPILWWSPDPRFVIFTDKVHISGSMRKVLRQERFSITYDTCFTTVMRECSRAWRPGQAGTWISDEMIEAYTVLHAAGYTHSVEVWQGTSLVGGLYGVSVGGVFCGESMFSRVSNASKAGFLTLARNFQEIGISLVDSQVHTDYLETLGAEHIPRSQYLDILASQADRQDLSGSWTGRFAERVVW